MDFTIPEDLALLQQTVRRFVQEELMPLEQDSLGDRELAKARREALQKKVQGLGLWMLHVPEEFGGGGVSNLGMCLVFEELSKTVVGADVIFGADQPLNLLYVGTPEQKEKYLYPVVRGEMDCAFALTEPNAGSEAAAIETVAVRDGDNYVINGSKIFISRAWVADFAIVFAITDKQKRGRGGISAFIVPRGTPGYTVVRLIDTMGETGDRGPCELSFQDCVVPAANLLGQEGRGFELAQARLGSQRAYIASRCIGTAERCLKMAIDYSKQRITFGRPISERQAVQWMLADSAVEIHASRLMTHHCAWKNDQKQDVRHEASIVKLYASEMVGRVADRALQIHGGMGYTKDLPLERIYRGVRLQRIVEGTSEIHRFVIARNLLRD